MARYRFPLQKLLDIRIDKEEASKREFMEAQRQRLLEEERLKGLESDYKRYSIENRDDDIVKRRIRENYLTYMKKCIAESKEELQKRTELMEQKRQEMAQRQIERKTVELIKEKRIEAFNKEQDEIERKANDEFALYAYIRNLKGGEKI